MTGTVSVNSEPSPPEAGPILDLISRLAAPGGAVSATLYSMASDMRPEAIMYRQQDAMGDIEAGLTRFFGDAIRSSRVFTPVSSIPLPMTYPWPTTQDAIGEVEDTIRAALAEPAALATVQELAGQIEKATGQESPALWEDFLLSRIEELEQLIDEQGQTIEELRSAAGVSLTQADSRRRAQIAVFCLVQGILLVLSPVLDANFFTWLSGLVAAAFQIDKRPDKSR
jgi:hypothetical protein